MRLIAPTVLVLAAGLACAGCSGGSSSPANPAQALGGPALSGVVLDYTDALARDVPVQVVGQTAAGKTNIDGRIILPNTSGNQLLRVGDSITTPTLLVPYTSGQPGTFLSRPISIPSLGTGISGSIPPSIASVTTISGDGLPGVSLLFDAGTSVTNNPRGDVEVLGVSASRLPVPVLGGTNRQAEPKVAYAVEPHGVRFSPAATLRVPRLFPASAGPFEILRVDTNTGLWAKIQSSVSPVNSGSEFLIPVEEGTLYCVVPEGTATTVTITGRIVAGVTPIEGFRAECWNRVSAPTGADGTFSISEVPTSFGAYLVRAFPAEPGVGFTPEVVLVTSLTPTLGDVVVAARLADGLRPAVKSTNPADDARNVSRGTQVVVTFSEAIDSTLTKPFKVIGTKGEVKGSYGFDSPFAVRFRPIQRLDPSVSYTILIDTTIQDLAGNFLDDDVIVFSFTTQRGAAEADPTDTLAFGLAPLTAAAGDLVEIPGRNYTGGTTVNFAGQAGVVRSETSDLIQVEVPGLTPAGNSTVTLQAGSLAIASLQPLVLDLRGSVARILSGTSPDSLLVAIPRNAPPPQFVVDGSNLGGTTITVDGVGIAAVDSTVLIGGQTLTAGRAIALPIPAPATFLSGPVVVRGSNDNPGRIYRFLLVREE
ncbi:MAG: Ig-like domain-containing protein [Planctomycetes bacterium]|nr:Ig-like domain-containing protein [Planctomycetota bacterium]